MGQKHQKCNNYRKIHSSASVGNKSLINGNNDQTNKCITKNAINAYFIFELLSLKTISQIPKQKNIKFLNNI